LFIYFIKFREKKLLQYGSNANSISNNSHVIIMFARLILNYISTESWPYKMF